LYFFFFFGQFLRIQVALWNLSFHKRPKYKFGRILLLSLYALAVTSV